ncbi:MAG: Na+/H+ antiporter NhaA [Rhodospirillaceae bacterium]
MCKPAVTSPLGDPDGDRYCFAFVNAGVPIAGLSMSTIMAPVTQGVAAGLFIGKQAAVMLAITLARLLQIGTLPADATLRQV